MAIVGASNDPSRIGGRPLRYMIEAGFDRPIYPVNPNRASVQGLRAYPTITEVPEPVDCAIIAVPAKSVAEVLRDCAAKGVKSAILFSSGFAEVGADGAALQAELGDIIGRTGIRVLGPNCLGVLGFTVGFYATFSSSLDAGFSEPGPLAIISQSGAYGTHLYAVARSWGLGVRYVITTGNECDVDVAECIEWASGEDEVRVIAAYVEGVKDGAALMRALEKARKNRKPVIFMKVGRSEEGAAAAASHTASLAGADEIYSAVFKQYGVHRAETTEEMLDITYACTGGIFPKSNRIGLVTISGGVGAQMADFAKKKGLDVAPMPEAAQERLIENLPFAAARNPVDTTAQFFNDLSLAGKNFSLMLDAGKYDIAIAFFTIAAASRFIVDPLLKELEELRRSFPDRLIILSLMGPPDVIERYRGAGYLTFEDPCRAITAAAALSGFADSFANDAPTAAAAGKVHFETHDIPPRRMSEWECRDILSAAGVPLVEARLAVDSNEAAEVAEAFGVPVAMKVNAPDISHKTELGGIALNVNGRDEALGAFQRIMSTVEAARPGSRLDGIIVAPMVSGGVETILGIQVDPVFGPAVMFGLGGIFVEIFEDVSFRIAPFDKTVALQMIEETKGAKLLRGAR
ncbi:MAG: acetate--CoA ligase family protein, partial [Methyloligellaceae bacterium]